VTIAQEEGEKSDKKKDEGNVKIAFQENKKETSFYNIQLGGIFVL
jgi:hypothetical protein